MVALFVKNFPYESKMMHYQINLLHGIFYVIYDIKYMLKIW